MQPQEAQDRESVSIRPAFAADAQQLRAWRSEPSVGQYQPLGAVSVGQLRTELASQRISDIYRGRGDKFQWIIQCEQRSVGWITLVVTNWEHGLGEIGYALTTAYQRRGIAPHALGLLLSDLFMNTRLERIEARCSIDNTGSRKVLESVGFHREGTLRGYFMLGDQRVDNFIYAILRSDFLPDTR